MRPETMSLNSSGTFEKPSWRLNSATLYLGFVLVWRELLETLNAETTPVAVPLKIVSGVKSLPRLNIIGLFVI